MSLDTQVLSHEIAELYDDPLVANCTTPAWGGTGQTWRPAARITSKSVTL